MRTIRCVCGEIDAELIGPKEGGVLVKCTNCGLYRMREMPDDFEKLYTEGNDYHQTTSAHTAYRDRFAHDYEVGQQRVREHLGWLHVLDVGCANGGFVAAMSDAGACVQGLEINPGMAAWTQEQTGCVVHTSWDTVEQCFNIITLHDVIEHIEDPVGELQRIARYLERNGTIVLDTPDIDDPRFTELGVGWHHIRPVEHVFYYNETTLTRMVETAGLRVGYVDRPIQGKLVAYVYAD